MPTPVGYVTIRCQDLASTLLVRLSDDRPTVSAGYGGWEEVARPRRVGVVTWSGSPVRRLSIGVLFDNFDKGEVYGGGMAVENMIDRLSAMARPRIGGTPPSVTIEAPGGHVPYQDVRWVIDGIDWGDALMNSYGNRVRQAAVLSLVELVSDELVDETTPANKRKAKSAHKTGKNRKRSAKAKRHPAKRKSSSKARTRSVEAVPFEGEDLLSVAARELGDSRRWREIADLNGIRDPRAVHVGQVLRLP
jgi:hypothetical protein